MSSKSKLHQGDCGPCHLCRKTSSRYTHPQNIKGEVLQLITKFKKAKLSKKACICHACLKQASRNLSNPSFQPRWMPKEAAAVQYCGVLHCKEIVYRHTSIATPSLIQEVLCQNVMTFVVAGDITTPLCQSHYMYVYNALQCPADTCESCGSKCSTQYTRHCPSPEIINPYLTTVTNEESTLTKASKICNPCYQFFTRVINQQQSGNSIGLAEVQDKIARRIQDLIQRELSQGEYFELVFCYYAQELAMVMKKNEATLLPSSYNAFCDSAMDKLNEYPYFNITNNDIPCRRWFTSRLHHYFLNSITFECKHRSIGTMIYHKDCDILCALSLALAKQRQANLEKSSTSSPPKTTPATNMENSMVTVAGYLNNKLHEQSKKFIHQFQTVAEYEKIDLSAIANNTDKTLLKFISQLTCTVREGRKLFQPPSETSDELNEEQLENEDDAIEEPTVKSIRQFYILCVLLFNTNKSCWAPLHVMLTEAILCHGGNNELVKIMNRLGAAASLDTCNRLATQVAQVRLEEGVKRYLVPSQLVVATVDNVDILQPHAVVSSLDATRSWHGTSVQCVQPLPTTGTLNRNELVAVNQTNISQSPVVLQRHKRRRRTLSEQASPHTITTLSHPQFTQFENISYEVNTNIPTIKDFLLTEREESTIQQLKVDIHQVMLLKYFRTSLSNAPHLPGITKMVHCIRKQSEEKEISNVVYANILSEKADCKATILKVIDNLHKTFICDLNQKWVIIIGDAKIFDMIQKLRLEYKESLKWLIPIPGDWHVLFNYQKVLMKPYADGGLISLAKTTGYRAETLKSLRNATNFRRTHLFFLQSFEAFYQYFLKLFYSSKDDEDEKLVHELLKEFKNITSDADLECFRDSVMKTTSQQAMREKYSEFKKFLDALSQKQDTIKFWNKFLFENCAPYIGLYTALRYRNWFLRTASLKQLAAVYTAFDRPTYQQLIPQHLFDLALMPDYIKEHFEKGCFAIRLTESEWCGVALDECHEMCINKDAKLAVIRPSKDKMTHIANYFGFKAKCMKNLQFQLFPERHQRKKLCYVPSTRDKSCETNAIHMVQKICSHGMCTDNPENQGLINFIEMKQASPDQAHDLLNFREIGQQSFENTVKSRYLNVPSTNAPLRKKRLQTFTTSEVQKRKITLVEKERKISQRFLKRQLAWMAEKDISPKNAKGLFASISSLPRALIGKDGLPYKANKSKTTSYLERRYKDLPVIRKSLPWAPTTVILEGMFLIQTTPLPENENMRDYARMLFDNCVKKYLNTNVLEIHTVFETLGAYLKLQRKLNKIEEICLLTQSCQITGAQISATILK